MSHPKQADMVGHHLHRIDFQVVAASDVLKDLFQTLSHRSLQYKFAVFRGSDEMVFEIINRMFGTFDRTHPEQGKDWICLRRMSTFFPPASSGVSSGGLL